MYVAAYGSTLHSGYAVARPNVYIMTIMSYSFLLLNQASESDMMSVTIYEIIGQTFWQRYDPSSNQFLSDKSSSSGRCNLLVFLLCSGR